MDFVDKIKKGIKMIRDSWNNYPFFASFCILTLVFLAYSFIYINNQGISALDDQFFHFKYAYLLWISGWDVVTNFDWISLSRVAQEHTGYELSLFQISMIPFTFVRDMIVGLKLYDIFGASLCLGLMYYVFRKSQIKAPLIFLLILSSSGYFLARILMGRGFVLIIALAFLEIYLAVGKKYKKLFWIFLLHVLWHQATFFFPLMIVAVVEAARYIASQKMFWKNFFSAGIASVLGMAFSLNFPYNIIALIKGLRDIHMNIIQSGFKAEGNEVYVKNSLSSFFGSSEFFFLIFFICTAAVIYYYILGKREKKVNDNDLSVLMYAIFFFSLISIAGSLLVSGRFYDFYIPSVIFLGAIIITKITVDGKINLNKNISRYLFFGLMLFYIFSVSNVFLNLQIAISKNDYRPWKEAAEWVRTKSDGRESIFLQNWSYFPVSFFYNSGNTYTMGIEPITLLDYDPKLYWKWYNIFASNYYCEERRDCSSEANALAQKMNNYTDEQKNEIYKENGEKIVITIKNDFKARFIISDSSNFNKNLDLNNNLVKESFEVKSEINNSVVSAYELK